MTDPPEAPHSRYPAQSAQVDPTVMDMAQVDEHGQALTRRPVLESRVHKRSQMITSFKIRWELMQSQGIEHSPVDSEGPS
jgi:hypothetical protein